MISDNPKAAQDEKANVDGIGEEEKNQTKEFLENCEDYGLDEKRIEMHEAATKIKTIPRIEFGKFTCETWYYSPYPDEYQNIECLYICEFCLNFYSQIDEIIRHSSKCMHRCPPGDEIYRDGNVSVFEVDGQGQPIYVENLFFLSKLFLDHKNLASDMGSFLFYIACEYDENGYHIFGYFSKEKEFSKPVVSESDKGYSNNLSCILVLPFYQRKGYGKFLISFSYELGKIESHPGTPERPLSDLGHKTYVSWWTWRLLTYLEEYTEPEISIDSLADRTGIEQSDIKNLFESFKILR